MRAYFSLLLVGLSGILLFLAAQQNVPLRAQRQRLGISQADPLRNAPPMVAFTTVALGGFRGILADLLWLRTARLQQEGQYFELVQLADWITKLEPRFTSVWAYQAWNLAYNISVLFDDPADRWRWVRHGITLLRDQGLAYNPGEPRLLYELGWLFQNKLGASLDSAHAFYQRAWATEIAALFDGPRPDYDAFLHAVTPAQEQRAHRLLEDYKLDPAQMREIETQYGPMDWRLPQAHAIYWARQSRLFARDFDALAADRMIFQSLVEAFRQGSLFTGSRGDVFLPSPNPGLLPYVQSAFQEVMRSHPDQESFHTAYRYFLQEALVTLVSFNLMPEANALYRELQKSFPDEETRQDFDIFVATHFVDGLAEMSLDQARAAAEDAFYQAQRWQALGDAARAAGFDRLAVLAWSHYRATHADAADPADTLRASARERITRERGGLR